MVIESVTQATRGGRGSDDSLPGQDDTGDAGSSERAGLGRDEMFDLLRNRRRRDVLVYLDSEAEGSATLDTLAEHIAARENDLTVDQLSSAQRKRVYIGLYQGHLPKMDDLGVVAYDQDRGTVELQDISQLRPYLYDSDDDTSPASLYLALAVTGVVIVGLSGVGPAAAVPAAALAVLSTVSLLAVALLDAADGTPDWLP